MKIIELNHKKVRAILPDRDAFAHKGCFGRILLLCGSRGYSGAAALAALGALRSGAGLVYLCVPESIYQITASKLLEPIVLPMPDADGKFSKATIDNICSILPKMDAVLIGPGMGVSHDTIHLTDWLLRNCNVPVVVDADGINVLAEHIDILRGRTSPTILTPHTGEFVRLGGSDCADRLIETIRIAEKTGAIIVHKGHRTIIADGKVVYRNTTGNPGMAVGGSGDVLSGMITALLGQKIAPLEAAACSAWLHGAAGDVCAKKIGQYGMLPSDMLRVLPRLMK